MKAKIYKTQRSSQLYMKNMGEYEFKYRNTDVVETYDKTDDLEANLINIYPKTEYHTFYGFGGAFTETAAISWSNMTEERKKELIRAYFDPNEGIGYTVGRISINSCDFSADYYTYTEEGDTTLETFDISHDTKTIIPMLREAGRIAPLWIFASPWSPPAYMKTSGSVIGGHLRHEYYELWAEYIRRFVHAYREHGVKISAVTVQNEPRHHQQWESCLYSPEEERELISFLYRALKGLDVKIICYDHCRERLVERSEKIFDLDGGYMCDGIANHWYSGDHFGEIRLVRERWSDKLQVASEGCCFDTEMGIKKTKVWSFAEKYAHDISGAINAGLNYYCDWNLTQGEDNQPMHNREGRNIVDTPIYCDKTNDKIVYQPSYYYIGHYSKFIRPGAKCIAHSCYSSCLEVSTFKNEDGGIVCVILNRTESDMNVILRIGDDTLCLCAEAHSIQSAVISE